MPLLGKIISRAIKLRNITEFKRLSAVKYQNYELKWLLKKAEKTAFGKHYQFSEILKQKNMAERFREIVPVHDYDKIFNEWWNRTLKEESDVCWPGEIRHFALSSGTTGSASKRIPVTAEMTRSIQKASIKQIFSLAAFNLPDEVFEKGLLLLGGSTRLNKIGNFYEGDMSGISASQIPFWFQRYYKPGGKIAEESDWNVKLNEIAKVAPDWDIGIIAGIPAWIQIMLEKVMHYHQVDHIHEIWPNLSLYVYGGTAFQPYIKGFEKLLGKPIGYMETYIASEGYIAFQKKPEQKNLNMLLNNGIYYEFIPFNDENFTPDGELKNIFPESLKIDEVRTGKPYAILLSTCSGAWRYLIGDVIEFDDVENALIRVTGRTKHFLNLCGEHLSVDNMNQAIRKVEKQFALDIREFTVHGYPVDNRYGHLWYVGTKDRPDKEAFRKALDEALMEVNDDYKTERSIALKAFDVEFVDPEVFYEFMEKEGKAGGQNKFPRVLRGKRYKDWYQHSLSYIDSV